MENPSKVGVKLKNSSKGLKNAFEKNTLKTSVYHIIKLAKKLKSVRIINDTIFYIFLRQGIR